MSTKPPASIGDAIIYTTKAAVVAVALIVLAVVVVVVGLIAADQSRGAIASLEGQVADLGDKLNACLVAGDAPRNLLRE